MSVLPKKFEQAPEEPLGKPIEKQKPEPLPDKVKAFEEESFDIAKDTIYKPQKPESLSNDTDSDAEAW